MELLLFATISQALLFLPLALSISISYHLLRATDMTLEGSFVLGASVFAKSITSGLWPSLGFILGLVAGSGAGILVSFIQRGGKIKPLLAGVLATFILSSGNLIIMGRPNINLLSQPTLLSKAFAVSEGKGWALVVLYCVLFCVLSCLLLCTRFGLILRASGDNPHYLQRLSSSLEKYRLLGFAFTNMLASFSGILTAQVVGYADIGMGLGMTLTGIGAIILGQQVLKFFWKPTRLTVGGEFVACGLGVILYFFAINGLLRLNINPLYLKIILGLTLIISLRTASRKSAVGEDS